MMKLNDSALEMVNGGTPEEAMKFASKMGKKYNVRKLWQVLGCMTDEELAYFDELWDRP